MQQRVTFVLRVTVDATGEASAVLELVRTGRKEPVTDISTLGDVVAGMLSAGVTGRDPAADPDGST